LLREKEAELDEFKKAKDFEDVRLEMAQAFDMKVTEAV